jgi:hypothetical protein
MEFEIRGLYLMKCYCYETEADFILCVEKAGENSMMSFNTHGLKNLATNS